MSDHLDANRPALYLPAADDDRVVPFEIEPGTPARAISEQLAAAALILDAELFEAYVRSIDAAEALKAGTFPLRANMTPVEIAEILLKEQVAGVPVTIPEGRRLEQVAEDLEEDGFISSEEYKRIAQTPDISALERTPSSQSAAAPQVDPPSCCSVKVDRWPFLAERPEGASLEGFLFPATYELPAIDPTASDLIVRQLDAFAVRILPLFEQAVAAGQEPPELYEALILASIVEREAVVALERAAIAGVLLNRLDRGMMLEVDATVQYAMGYQAASGQWWKTPVFLEEYKYADSPYNTYMHEGLPPGPIASPGEAAFRAVLYPERHEFYYYVATPDGSGAHVFAKTYDEHVENVKRYLGQ